MENKVNRTVEKYSMLTAGDTVVIGLSGGADSCALLHYLVSVKEKYGLKLIACHVNHMLRGQEADRDEEFCRALCSELGVEFRVIRRNVLELSKSEGIGTEECGRRIRYDFFEETASRSGARIATAHNASDNAETVIFNITRGCGIKGLCGIPPVRGKIIRPLINIPRCEIEEYMKENNYSYVSDSTNFTREYTRNKIRLDVIPTLKDINPSFESTVSDMSDRFRCQVEELYSKSESLLNTALVEDVYGKRYKADILYGAESAVFAQAVSMLLSPYAAAADSCHISLIRDICRTGGATQIKKDLFVVSNQGYLRIINKKKSYSDDERPPEISVFCDSAIVINDKKIDISDINIAEFNNGKKINKFLFNNSLDYDTIPLSAVFRTRRSGDSFAIPGRNITKTLKKYFIELHIPAEKRDGIIVLADGSRILWIDGIGAAMGCCISEKTKRIFYISVNEP